MYTHTNLLATVCVCVQTDLVHTLGESAALGAPGVVLWGELKFAKSKVCNVCDKVIMCVCVFCAFVCNPLPLSRPPASVHPSQRLHTHCLGSLCSVTEV